MAGELKAGRDMAGELGLNTVEKRDTDKERGQK